MTRLSALCYIGTVMIMVGLGVSLLTVLRGLPAQVFTSHLGPPGNSTSKLFMPPIWPPRNVRIAVYLSGGEIDLLIFDRPNYDALIGSGYAIPLKEFKGLKSEVINFEIPMRGEYYVVVKNRGVSTVDVEIVLTFWGFERDLTYLSLALLVLGASSWICGRFLKRIFKI
ncbi:MAG: hypothetical protein FGF52_01010 [Candidatus Brockarchaeota archaeon]|nr:hypothetical protein [Candidatus Brockarchaeota archaeon]